MNVIFRKNIKYPPVKNLKKYLANRSNSLSAQDLSIGFPKHQNFYQSPSSRRDIAILVWAIFGKSWIFPQSWTPNLGNLQICVRTQFLVGFWSKIMLTMLERPRKILFQQKIVKNPDLGAVQIY